MYAKKKREERENETERQRENEKENEKNKTQKEIFLFLTFFLSFRPVSNGMAQSEFHGFLALSIHFLSNISPTVTV